MKPGHLPPDCTPREALYFAAVWRADAIKRRRRLLWCALALVVLLSLPGRYWLALWLSW